MLPNALIEHPAEAVEDNRNLIQDQSNQALTQDAVIELKERGLRGEVSWRILDD